MFQGKQRASTKNVVLKVLFFVPVSFLPGEKNGRCFGSKSLIYLFGVGKISF